MKRFLIVSLIFISFSLALPTQCAKLPSHFSGIGIWIWKGIAKSGTSQPYADKAAKCNVSYVIIQTSVGKHWGTPINGRYTAQFNKNTPKRFHAKGIRCYAYCTAYLYKQSDISSQAIVNNAIRALHYGADGFVLDDVFNYGADRHSTAYVFSQLHHHMKACKLCQGKVLAFSTFPHTMRRYNFPWSIPIKYCKFYLPQDYWESLGRSPRRTLIYSQGSWDAKLAYDGHTTQSCRLVPTGQAYKNSISPKDLEIFLKETYQHYKGISIFRWELISNQRWYLITKYGAKFKSTHNTKSASLFDILGR